MMPVAGGDTTRLALVAAGLSAILVFALRQRRRQDGVSRICVVSGGASGLGKCVCEHLVARGDRVVALDVNEAQLATLAEELNAECPGACLVAACDVSDFRSVRVAAERVKAVLGSSEQCIDSVVNFAGLIRGGPMAEMDEKDMQMVMDVNVMGSFHVNKAFFPLLRRSAAAVGCGQPAPSPKIVNVASEVSLSWVSAAFNAPYSMSKFAIEALSTALRQEMMLLDEPVSVVTLNPGAMLTPMCANQQLGGSNQFFELHASRYPDSLWRCALLKGAVVATTYMAKCAKSPQLVADAVFDIVHATQPPDRVVVNASLQMRLSYLMPQWFLDRVVVLLMRG